MVEIEDEEPVHVELPIHAPEKSAGRYSLTIDQATSLFAPTEIHNGQMRGESEFNGEGHILSRHVALATTHEWKEGPTGLRPAGPLTIYGKRALHCSQPCEQGLEGVVCVEGKQFRAYTSRVYFELPDGRLIDCAILHVCKNWNSPEKTDKRRAKAGGLI